MDWFMLYWISTPVMLFFDSVVIAGLWNRSRRESGRKMDEDAWAGVALCSILFTLFCPIVLSVVALWFVLSKPWQWLYKLISQGHRP